MILLCPARLPFERCHLTFELVQHILNAHQVLARPSHLALGGQLAAAKPGRPGRLLEEQAKLLGLGVDELIDPPLLDDGVRLGTHSGPEKELGDVLQPARRPVDEILGFPGTEIAAGHEHFAGVGELGRQALAAPRDVVGRRRRKITLIAFQQERDLRHAERALLGIPVEDDVLHERAAEMFRALLA